MSFAVIWQRVSSEVSRWWHLPWLPGAILAAALCLALLVAIMLLARWVTFAIFDGVPALRWAVTPIILAAMVIAFALSIWVVLPAVLPGR